MFLSRRLPEYLRANYTCDEIAGLLTGTMYGGVLWLLPIVARKLGATDFQIALLETLPFVGAFFTFLWAQFSKQRSLMPMMLWVRGIGRAALLLAAFSTGPGFLIGMAFVFWFFEMAGSPAYTGIMKDIYPEEHRGRAMGFSFAVMTAATMLSAFAVGRYLEPFSL